VIEQIHLWQEEPILADGNITLSATIELPNQSRFNLWYSVPEEYNRFLSPNCDPFVVAIILFAMKQRVNLAVRGAVSPSLLRNLTEFQIAWHCWHPQLYQLIDIAAEVEAELPINSSNATIAAFSGGVDSCFTVWQHQTGNNGRLKRPIDAGLMVGGFDIPLEKTAVFDAAAAKSKTMLASLGVELILMKTNFRQLPVNWEDAFGTAIASSMMLLQGGYRTGLIGSSAIYSALLIPYGSNPITDPLLSSHNFEIIHDAAGFDRLDKIRQLAQWPEALENLRVCWEGDSASALAELRQDSNCGKCEKCVRTILGFRLQGIPLPACFPQDITDAQILALRGIKEDQLTELDPILAAAKTAKIQDSWVKALETTINRNRQIAQLQSWKTQLKQRLPPKLLAWWQQRIR